MKPVDVDPPLGNLIFGGVLAFCGAATLLAQLPNLWAEHPAGVDAENVVPSLTTSAVLALLGLAIATARHRVTVDGAVVRWTHSLYGFTWRTRELPRDEVRELKTRSGSGVKSRWWELSLVTRSGETRRLMGRNREPSEARELARALQLPLD